MRKTFQSSQQTQLVHAEFDHAISQTTPGSTLALYRGNCFAGDSTCGTTMATMILLCRVCLSSIDKNHSVALFSGRSVSDWPRHLSTLLCISVRESDGFSHYLNASRKCSKHILLALKVYIHCCCETTNEMPWHCKRAVSNC